MSEEQEIAMGKEADPQIIAQFGLYDDTAIQSFISSKGKQMAAISHRPKLEHSFRVLNSEVVNAFAVPGGYVYFTRGIMAHFNSEADFSGVLGHEIGHVERRTGNLTQARLIYHETLRGWRQLGNRAAIAHQLECFGFLAIHAEEPQRAAKIFGTAEAVREKIQARMTDYERVEYDQAVTHLRSMLTEAEFSDLWEKGRSMTMEQAIEFALDES